MLRILSGVCHFPKTRGKICRIAHPIRKIIPLLSIAILGLSGCAQEQLALARGAAQDRDGERAGTTTQVRSGSAKQAVVANSSPPEPARPAASSAGEPARSPGKECILDL